MSMSWTGKIGWGLVIALLAIALLAPHVAPHDIREQDLTARLQPPSRAHPMGRDEFGRDVLSRLLYGARVSLRVGLTVVAICASVGTIIGALAGYYGGWTDRIISGFLFNTLLAFPGILLALAMIAFLGPSVSNLILALSIIGWVSYARLIRGQVLKVKELDFVHAARAMGASDARILLRHILPNVVQPLIVQATLGVAGAVLAEASLSFLGLGVQEPMPSWGKMLDSGRAYLTTAPHLVIFPGLAIAVTVLAFNFAGDGLNEWLNPQRPRSIPIHPRKGGMR
ncbi:Glutathione transport system permease protein GsiD [bacterium HR10]|nr:Glutathione transport system permease protein GsiD [bacterium HR10]